MKKLTLFIFFILSFLLTSAQYIPPSYPESLAWLYQKYQIEDFFNQIRFTHDSFDQTEYFVCQYD